MCGMYALHTFELSLLTLRLSCRYEFGMWKLEKNLEVVGNSMAGLKLALGLK